MFFRMRMRKFRKISIQEFWADLNRCEQKPEVPPDCRWFWFAHEKFFNFRWKLQVKLKDARELMKNWRELFREASSKVSH